MLKFKTLMVAVFVVLSVPVLAAALNGCILRDTPSVTRPTETVRVVALPENAPPAPPALVEPVEVRPVVIRASTPRSAKAEKPACRLRILEQGGSPSAPFVLECG
jgi:hypothetical protein